MRTRFARLGGAALLCAALATGLAGGLAGCSGSPAGGSAGGAAGAGGSGHGSGDGAAAGSAKASAGQHTAPKPQPLPKNTVVLAAANGETRSLRVGKTLRVIVDRPEKDWSVTTDNPETVRLSPLRGKVTGTEVTAVAAGTATLTFQHTGGETATLTVRVHTGS